MQRIIGDKIRRGLGSDEDRISSKNIMNDVKIRNKVGE